MQTRAQRRREELARQDQAEDMAAADIARLLTAIEGRGTSDAAKEEERRFVQREVRRIDVCEGTPRSAMREWLRSVREAIQRVPRLPLGANGQPNAGQAARDRAWGLQILEDTSAQDLRTQVDVENANVPQLTIPAILDALQLTFLGRDEEAVRRSAVKKAKQKGELAAYSREFSRLAAEAYPIPRAPQTEQDLAEAYLAGLKDRKLARDVLKAEPRLVTLAGVKAEAERLEAANSYADRILGNDVKQEVAAVGKDPFEMLAKIIEKQGKQVTQLAETVEALTAKVEKMSTLNPEAKAFQPKSGQAKRPLKDVECFNCRERGHYANKCPQPRQKKQAAVVDTDGEE